MKIRLYIFCCAALGLSCNSERLVNTPAPVDTVIKYDMEDGSQKDLKKAWLAKIHQAKEGVDWKGLEKKTMLKKHALRNSQSKSGNREIIVEGLVEGKWVERGSRNQTGNVLATAYNKYTDELYTVSASGIIWKGNSLGENWQPQNETLRFDNRFLAGFYDENTTRLISSMRGDIYFSDDKGKGWVASTGLPGSSSSIRKWQQTQDTELLFVLHKNSYWEDVSLYFSSDRGESFSLVQGFTTHDLNNFGICSPHGSNDLYLIEQLDVDQSITHKWNEAIQKLEVVAEESPLGFGSDGRGNLIAVTADSINILYSYDEKNDFWKSIDEGLSWEYVSTLPTRPWEVGVFVSSSNPDNMIYGEVNSYRSLDGGETWHLINEWYDYYNDPLRELHADIMFIKEFEDLNGDPFILISNHGGINRTDDGSFTNINISTDGLNVSQYYDVRTHPFDPTVVIAGSQDQGLQRGTILHEDEETAPMEQLISGDYGHIEFSQGGLGMWVVYPGGWVSFYDNPIWGGIIGNYTLESVDESVWIPPIVASPFPDESAVYMAGGNINGGAGSHLIKLEYDPIEGVGVSQYDYNFRNGGDVVASIAFNHFDPNIIYVAGQNGSFFISEDGGENFEKIWISVPDAHYLYGSCIYPSKLDPGIVYISGSGYSNAPVIKSVDGGRSFRPMDTGLPPTLVFNIEANEDESLFFAASEAGPYVYVTEKDEWFDMSGSSAPANTYWSVEYLEEQKLARFGTYGRGIWDFYLDELNVSSTLAEGLKQLSVFPNPTSSEISFGADQEIEELQIFNTQGALVIKKRENYSTIDVSNLDPGLYHIIARPRVGGIIHASFVKI